MPFAIQILNDNVNISNFLLFIKLICIGLSKCKNNLALVRVLSQTEPVRSSQRPLYSGFFAVEHCVNLWAYHNRIRYQIIVTFTLLLKTAISSFMCCSAFYVFEASCLWSFILLNSIKVRMIMIMSKTVSNIKNTDG